MIKSRWSRTISSPCKINLHLVVGERRSDGFHELESIFAALDYSDTLNFTFFPENDAKTILSIQKDGVFQRLSQKGQIFPSIPMEKHLVYQAVEVFRSKTGFSGNLEIELIKRIAPGSGLGCSSSNAASALIMLNGLYGSRSSGESRLSGVSRLSKESLMEMAKQLGSDVPFFIEIGIENRAKTKVRFVRGRGEILSSLPAFPRLEIVLVFPGFASYTGTAFALLDTHRKASKSQNLSGSLTGFSAGDDRFFLSNGLWIEPKNWNFSNDFLDLFINHGSKEEKSAYTTILADLKNVGAVFSGLSGSGSACFGIFSGQEEAERAVEILNGAFYVVQRSFFLRY